MTKKNQKKLYISSGRTVWQEDGSDLYHETMLIYPDDDPENTQAIGCLIRTHGRNKDGTRATITQWTLHDYRHPMHPFIDDHEGDFIAYGDGYDLDRAKKNTFESDEAILFAIVYFKLYKTSPPEVLSRPDLKIIKSVDGKSPLPPSK